MSTLLTIILGALVTCVGCWSLGSLIIRDQPHGLSALERLIFRFLAGSSLLSVIVFFLCTIGQARKGAFLAVVLCAAAAAIFVRRLGMPVQTRTATRLSRDQASVALLVFIGFSLIYVVNAVAPEHSPDGVTYHLGNVSRWWRLHGFDRYTGSIYSDWSQGFELLFLVAFSIGRHSSCSLFHCVFAMLLPVLFYSYGGRVGARWVWTVAGLVIYISPVVGRVATSAYNDMAVATLLFALFYLVEIAKDRGEDERVGLIRIAGLLAGFAFAVKYTAIVGLLYLLVRLKPRQIANVTAAFAVCAAPWLIRNAIVLKNPVSPFFNGIFDNPYVTHSFEVSYRKAMALYPELTTRASLPWLWAVNGSYVGGVFGPWLLLTPLALLAVHQAWARRMLATAALIGWPVLLNCGTRFALPAVMFITPVLVAALARLSIRPVVFLLLCAACSLPPIVSAWTGPHAWKIDNIPWRAALRIEPEPEFLTRKVSSFPIAAILENQTPQDAKIFATLDLPLAYFTRRVWHNWQSTEAQRAYDALLYGVDPNNSTGQEIRFEFAAQPIQGFRLRPGRDVDAFWQIAECQLQLAGAMVAQPSAETRPNRWDARFAVDQNEATRWSSQGPIRTSSELSVAIGSPHEVDSIVLISNGLPMGDSWRLELQDAAGQWRTVIPRISASPRTPNPEARAIATRALKSMDFSYIVVQDDDPLGKDLVARSADWRLETIAKSHGLTVFRIQ